MTSPPAGQDRNPEPLTEQAWAKINIGLKILGRRSDGFHDICSVGQTVGLADLLQVRPAERTYLTCSQPALPTDEENLVLRALRAFEAKLTEPSRPLHIHLEKQIPTGAGLGGGSGDAAAMLRLLSRLYDQPLTPDQLAELAAEVGSDVPFQLVGGTALIEGRGERLHFLRWDSRPSYLLIYPGIRLSTAWAYDSLEHELTADSAYLKFISSLRGGCVDAEALFDCLENDFLPLVERTYPIVAQLSKYLESAGARASSMSGSGSTVFGVFDDRTAAYQAQEGLQARGCRSFLCQPVNPSAGS